MSYYHPKKGEKVTHDRLSGVWTVTGFAADKNLAQYAILARTDKESRVGYLDEIHPVPAVDRLAKIGEFLPTEEDIGRGVVYMPGHGQTNEDGIITSVNDSYVFVRYAGDIHSKATRYEDLRWLSA